jgi:hypothetical protein
LRQFGHEARGLQRKLFGLPCYVIPANAGIQKAQINNNGKSCSGFPGLDSRVRGNDGTWTLSSGKNSGNGYMRAHFVELLLRGVKSRIPQDWRLLRCARNDNFHPERLN